VLEGSCRALILCGSSCPCRCCGVAAICIALQCAVRCWRQCQRCGCYKSQSPLCLIFVEGLLAPALLPGGVCAHGFLAACCFLNTVQAKSCCLQRALCAELDAAAWRLFASPVHLHAFYAVPMREVCVSLAAPAAGRSRDSCACSCRCSGVYNERL
jgi:hypothetical protein